MNLFCWELSSTTFSALTASKCCQNPYVFKQFEFWLNNFSAISKENNALIRGKIAGKYLPREEYQNLFPIGMGAMFPGTHFVAAHLSPDVDSTIASLWGWVDALAARVGTGQHLWSLPGGPPESPITQICCDLFGKGVFAKLAHSGLTLTLSAMDLFTQSHVVKENGATSTSSLEHGVNEKAVILVDANGHYCGDWRSSDVEPVRQVIILFKSYIRWFENNLHLQLISLFAKQELHLKDLPAFFESVFEVKIAAIQELDEKQKLDLEKLLIQVFSIPKGLESTFSDLSVSLERRGVDAFISFRQELLTLQESDLFDPKGALIEERPKIFNRFQRILSKLDKAIHRVRDYVERLDIAIQIKHDVLGKKFHYLTLRSDVEDIRIKMDNYNYLTVVIPEEEGKLYPVGVVWAHDLRKNVLGTVAFRDFCNLEEVKMASYLSVISVIDHHKSNLTTLSPPLALIGDVQSCNVLLAEQALAINERYSLGGMTKESLETQLREEAPMQRRARLMQKLMAAEMRGSYFVHPVREMQEYLCFLHAILDDTDLLTKVTPRDVVVVTKMLNRLKSLAVKSESVVIQLDDIPKDQNFAKNAAKRILQNDEMYSLYSKVYAFKEIEVAENLKACTIFQDTKEQSGCCRIGQTKLFASNYPLFKQQRQILESFWRTGAETIYQNRPEIDLHLQMISTITSAKEVYEGLEGRYGHPDELWFWIPATEQAQRHLASFLSGFQKAVEELADVMSLELQGDEAALMDEIFLRNFLAIPIQRTETKGQKRPQAILRYPAGSLNSRKAMITPYLPRPV